MNQTQTGKQSAAAVHDAPLRKEGQSFVLGFWGVRYQVKDVSRSIEFYTQRLGFKLDYKNLPKDVRRGDTLEPASWNDAMARAAHIAQAHRQRLVATGRRSDLPDGGGEDVTADPS